MSISATIAGIEYGVIPGSIQPENKVDDRDTLTINVLDVAGTTLFQKYQPVVVVDSILGTIFTGIINTPTMQQILWPANQKIWQLQCVDQAYRLDKELSNWTYKDQFAGTILAHQLQTYSAADHVSAEFALRWEELMSAWAQGTLSGVSATNNTSTGNPGAGDLELATGGSQVLTGGSGSGFTLGNGLLLTGYASSGYSSAYVNRQIWSGSLTIAATTDQFYYDVWINSSSPAIKAGCDFICSDGTMFSASAATDVQYLGPSLATDLSGLANDTWYTRFFPTIPAALVGKTIVSVLVGFNSSTTGTYTAYFRRINYKSGSTTTTFFGDSSALQTNTQTSNLGYTNVSLTQVQVEDKKTIFTHSGLSIGSAGIVQSSLMTWTSATPSGATALRETSVDNGATWQTITSGSAIPNLLAGMVVAGRSVLYRDMLTVGTDPTASIGLSGPTLLVNPAYASTKADVIASYQTATDFNTGTLTNLITVGSGSTDGITLNGVQENWDDGDFSNQPLFGTASPFQQVENKQMVLQTGTGTDVRSQLQFAGQWQNFTAEVDLPALATGAAAGASLVYRCTNWGNSNDSYAYVVGISTTTLQFGHGTNSTGAGAFTLITSKPIALAANSVHRLKVVVNGNSHTIYLDGVQLVSTTDATYTAAGYLGLRLYNNTGSTLSSAFDNFGVCAALSGTWQSPSINIAGPATYGNAEIFWDVDGIPDSTCAITGQTSIDGGTTWQSVTNGGAIPGLVAGQSLTGKTLILKLTLTANNAPVVPVLNGVTAWIMGQYNSTGTRSTAPLGYDTFVRANQAGWGTSTGGEVWSTSGSGTLAIASDTGTITNTGQTHIQSGSQTSTDESVLAEFSVGNTASQVGVEARYTNSSGTITAYRAFVQSGNFTLDKRVSGTLTTLQTVTFALTTGTNYTIRLICQGATIQARIWQSSTSEPTTWQLSQTDSSIASGGVAVSANVTTGDTATFTKFIATLYPDPALSLVNANRVANSLVNWNAILPTNTSLSVQTSVDNGVTWSTISAAGNAIPNLTLQPTATVDDYSADSHTSYTTTNGVGGSAATWTWDTPNKRLQAVGGSKAVALYNGVTVTDVDMFVDIYQSENAGLVWRWSDASDYYELIVTDSAASSPNVMTLNKIVAGTLTALASSTGTFTFPTQTHHYVRVTMLGSAITCYFDGVSILTVTDASLTSGSVGVRNDTGTSYYYYLYVQPQGQDVSDAIPGANTVCTKMTLTSTDPTATPQVTDMQVLVGGPTFWPGTLIPTATYNSDTSFVSSNAEDLKNQSDYFWSMADTTDNYGNYDVSFQPRTATPAPWALDENNYQMIAGQQINDILLAGIGQVYGADLYRNRMVIKNAIATSAYDQIFIGDGKATSWTLSNPIVAAPTDWTLNGLPVSFGLQGVDSGKQYYYQIGSTSITQDSGQTVLTVADSLEVKYSGSSVVDVTRDNLSIPGTITQSALAAITGDSGIVTAAVDVSGQNMSVAAAETYGDQMLARYGVIGVTFNFTTLRSGLREGQQLMLYTPHFNLNKVLTLVTDVRLSQQVAPGVNGGNLWSWQVTAQTGPALGSWIKMLSLGLGN